ncbi:unnamed protein product [Ranitomeya imitator]|uniref:Uncharacterized protein n=1 Tax=Ranitomeya imitator TaxID=111125 RepID=A0ABN9L7A1_9NEOB|nr:unnamed protein product [Ranitomeya imitator]
MRLSAGPVLCLLLLTCCCHHRGLGARSHVIEKACESCSSHQVIEKACESCSFHQVIEKACESCSFHQVIEKACESCSFHQVIEKACESCSYHQVIEKACESCFSHQVIEKICESFSSYQVIENAWYRHTIRFTYDHDQRYDLAVIVDGLFGQCRDRSERDVGQFQATPATLQQLQAMLRRLTAKGLSWKDDVTQRVMAHEMGRIPQHKSLETLDLLDEDRSSVPVSPGRSAIQRLTGAGPVPLQRWSHQADALHYFRPRVSSSDSSPLPQRLPGNFKQNMSPLLDRYLTYFLLTLPSANSQLPWITSPWVEINGKTVDFCSVDEISASCPELQSSVDFTSANPQPSYQDLTRARNPSQHVFTATHTWPDGARRLIYGRYEGGRDPPALPLQVPSDSHHSWSELRRKLPRGSADTGLADDAAETSERIERMSQMNRVAEGSQIRQSESREEGGRMFRGSIGIQNAAEAQSAPEMGGLLDVQSLAGVLEKYGVDLKQLSDAQQEQLSVLLQMLQTDAPQNQGARSGDRSPPKRTLSRGDTSPAPAALNAERDGDNVMSATPASITTHLAPDAQTMGEQQAHLLAAINQGSKMGTLEKKSYQEIAGILDHSELKPQVATEDYGYILTDEKPLSLFNGFRLLDILARRVHMSTSSFINISIAGSAVTFRIRKNRQNLTLSDITNQAMALKSDLQTETGVKIVQTGTGQVRKTDVMSIMWMCTCHVSAAVVSVPCCSFSSLLAIRTSLGSMTPTQLHCPLESDIV